LVAPRLHVVLRRAAIEHEFACTMRKRILDKHAGKTQPPLARDEAALGSQHFDAAWDRLGEPDGFEEAESCLVDALHVAFGEGLVFAALHARADRRLVDRNRPRPERSPRLAPASPPRYIFDYAHRRLRN